MEAAHTKGLTIIGKAFKALLRAGLIEDFEEIVDYMATDNNETMDEQQ